MQSIAVIGAGTMGAGIAQLAATQGCTVYLIDVDRDVVHAALVDINKRLDRKVQKGKITAQEQEEIVERIVGGDKIEALDDVELAIEAVVEKLEIKHTVFQQLERAVPDNAVLATNTSSLSVGQIAGAVADPSRVVGMHFFNPAPVMPLVEIISGKKSSATAVDTAFNAAKAWGKTPVRAADTPGFIVNRVARGFYLEAMRLLDEGVAGIDEIDHVMKIHGKFRMGPFELMDLIGIDVNLAVSISVWEQMGEPDRLSPRDIQRKLVSEKHIGRKTGQGFYKYADDRAVPAVMVERRSFELSPLLADVMLAFTHKAAVCEANSTEQYVLTRILAAIINEAGLAYDDQVASSDDIDTAMIKGTNYPKGPLAWADEIGHHTVCGMLRALNNGPGAGRYAAATLFGNG